MPLECLSPYTRDSPSGPTGTDDIQIRFAQRLRGVLRRINARIREAIDEDDLFGLRDESLAVDDLPERVFDFPTDRAKIRGFLQWFRTQLDDEFLTVVGPDSNQFLRAAYAAGIENANSQLKGLNISFKSAELETILSRPIHRSALQTLFTRAFKNLQSVRDDVAQAVREELVDGFTAGENPRDIARSLTDRVDSIGKHRATMIARSETINAHSEATLTRADEISRRAETDITARHGEWQDSRDARVCPFCRRLDGTELTIREMRTTAVEFRGQPYRLKPPAHPNGRCRIKLRLGAPPTTPLRERLDSEMSLV